MSEEVHCLIECYLC